MHTHLDRANTHKSLISVFELRPCAAEEGPLKPQNKLNSDYDALYRNYMLAGLAFGLLFPLTAISMDLVAQGMPLSLNTVISIHKSNPLHYIIDSTPFILSLFAHFTIRFFIHSQERSTDLSEVKGILDQEKSEKELVSQQMLSILNLSPISYIVIGTEGHIHFVNKATKTILGSSETQGQNIFTFKTVKNSLLEEKLRSAIRGNHEELEAYKHLSATTGAAKVLNISMVPFKKNSESNLYEILMMSTDRTQEEMLLTQVEANFFNVVKGLARALDARDRYTSHHSSNVKAYTSMIVYHSQIDLKEREDILVAAELHDIGKIGVMDSILNKNGPLSEEEFESMRTHPTIGADIFAGIEGYHHISTIIRHHHERIDGKGYPAGLTGDEIPKGASIIAIADAFDAMTTDRVYRKALSIENAIEELKKGRGTQFHSDFVDVFVRHFKY